MLHIYSLHFVHNWYRPKRKATRNMNQKRERTAATIYCKHKCLLYSRYLYSILLFGRCDKWQWHRKLTNPLEEGNLSPGVRLLLLVGGKTIKNKCVEKKRKEKICRLIAHYLIRAGRFPADSDVNVRVRFAPVHSG